MVSFILLHLSLVHAVACTLTDTLVAQLGQSCCPACPPSVSVGGMPPSCRLFSGRLKSGATPEWGLTASSVNPVTFCCPLCFQCASLLLCWRTECWHTTCRNRRVSTMLVCHVTAARHPCLSCVGCIPVGLRLSLHLTSLPTNLRRMWLICCCEKECKKSNKYVVLQWMKQSAEV